MGVRSPSSWIPGKDEVMRALLVVAAIASAAAFVTGTARAQSLDAYPYSTRGGSTTRNLILEREMSRARQRTARLEYKLWTGQTPQRPIDNRGFGLSNLYGYDRPVWAMEPVPFWHGYRR